MKLLITGAASGIGLACAEYYAGQDVVAIDKNDVDLTDARAIKQFLKLNHSFDVMIHCAGIREIETPHRVTFERWQEVLNVNLTASFLLSQGLISTALDSNRPLSIINMASVAGFQAEPNRAAYVSSKFALIGLTKQLAYQYGKYGIRANAIAPGIIETALTKHYFDDPEAAECIRKSIPVCAWGQVEHVVPLVDMCVRNQYVNGSVLVCDGGWSVGRNI